ncbi:MAG: hypothetical protein V5B39_01700 [Accumulibacter sp.]|jgi:hypothetical protein|uniref:hypothetical protein n=1 Tax=Accumulibacter sp. TaxID=2053492 RepID=UPI002FC2EC74
METKVLSRNPPSPLKPDEGPNFTTHRLVRKGSVWIFQPTGFVKIFPSVFTMFGYVFIAASVLTVWQSLFNSLAALCGGALAIGVGRLIARFLGNTPRFDTMRRLVEVPEQPALSLRLDASSGTTSLDFTEVSELEIVHKRVTDTEIDDYDNYELNLVTQDGRRLNLVSHPNSVQIAREAQQLATVLGKPVADWRASTTARNGKLN